MQIVNETRAAPVVNLVPPSPHGYALVLAEVDLASVRVGVVGLEDLSIDATHESSSSKRTALHAALRSLASSLDNLNVVRSVSIFEAIACAPGSLQRFVARGAGGRAARYDTIVVAETASPADAERLIFGDAFAPCLSTIREASAFTSTFAVANVKLSLSERSP